MKPIGISKQTLLVALIPILVMVALLESYIIYSRFKDLETAFAERSHLLVHQLASSIEYEVFSSNTTALKNDVKSTLSQMDVSRVVVLDATAKPLAGGLGGSQVRYEDMLEKSNSSTPSYQDEEVLDLYEPIKFIPVELSDLDVENGLKASSTPAKPVGAVIIEFSKHRMNSQKHEILLLSLVFSLLVLMVAMILARWSARRITRPVIGMNEAMRSFGEGNLYTRISHQPDVLELKELSSGFNEMAKNIQHNQSILETRVAERTSALAASEHESRTLVDHSPDTIARYDKDLRRTYVNPAFAAMTEGGSDILLGKKPSEFPGGPNSDIYEDKIKEVFSTGKDVQFELKWTAKGEKETCSSIRLTAEYDMSGRLISVLAVGHDITELMESKEELNRKELAKSRFLAAAGHDLRQPLAAANLFIDALRYAQPTSEQKKIIQRLDQCMSTFNELLESLLNISKLDAGIIKPEYTSFSIANIFNWLEQSFTPIAQEKHLDFKMYFPGKKELIVFSDIDLIKSVLMNLVSNAIKYTSRGKVLVSARSRGGDVLFQVWDTGVGIKEVHFPYIFDEFFQINNQQRDRKSGLGLGLAITRRSISLLGGKITFRSHFGRGSVFEFRLPLGNSKAEVASPLGHDAALGIDTDVSLVRGKHFVIVEDDVLVAEALRKSLEMMGGMVEHFNDAEDALRNPRIGQADFYIADYMLGGTLNGIKFLLQLSSKLNKHFNAVLMTGDTSPSFIHEAERFGWPVLHKPVNLSQLIYWLHEQSRK